MASVDLGFAAPAPKFDEYGPDGLQYIPVDQIKIPEDRKKRFDWDKGAPQAILTSLESMGRLVNPISVRRAGDDGNYELVVGRKRLLAAKKLGWEKILCKIETWTEDEIAFLVIVENLHREQMTPAEELKALQKLYKEFERRFGRDPGQAVGGVARASSATRKGGKFVKDIPKDELLEGPSLPPPAVPVAGNAGGEGEVHGPPAERIRSFSNLISEQTGKQKSQTADDVKLIKTFNPDEMEQLGLHNPTKADLLKIANIEDRVKRGQVMSLFCAGQPVDEAIKTVTGSPEAKGDVAVQVKQAELTDEVWLLTYCDTLRPGLQDKTAYDIDALAWRHTSGDRSVYRGKIKEKITEARKKKWTPAVAWMARAALMLPPDEWFYCTTCYGKNEDHPDCTECHGAGYAPAYQKDYHYRKR